MKWKMTLVVMILITTMFFPLAYACDCMARTPEQHVKNSDAVFIGEFQEIKNGKPVATNLSSIDAVFRVIRVLKGELEINGFVTVRTLNQSSACGITKWMNEKSGTSWVIYARQIKGPKDQSDNMFERELLPLTAETILVTTICSGTLQADRAAEHITYFDSLAAH